MEFQWVKKSDRQYVSVIFTPSLIKLVEVACRGGKYHLENVDLIPAATEAVVGDEIKQTGPLIEQLRQYRQERAVKANQAATLVDGAGVMSKSVMMDAGLSESEMEAQAWVMAGDLFPKVAEDISLDFCPTDKVADDMIEVLLVACRKEKIDQRVEVLEHAGFSPKLVDVSYYSLAHSFKALVDSEADKGGPIGIVNIGLQLMSLSVVKGHELLYSREQNFNGLGLLPGFGQNDFLTNWVTSLEAGGVALGVDSDMLNLELVSAVQQLLQYYDASELPVLEKLLISGELAIDPRVAGAIQEATTIPSERADPLTNMVQSKRLDKAWVERISPVMLMNVGLAMHGLTHDRY